MSKKLKICISRLKQVKQTWEFRIDLFANTFFFTVEYLPEDKTYNVMRPLNSSRPIYSWTAKQHKPTDLIAKKVLLDFVQTVQDGICAQCLQGCAFFDDSRYCESHGGHGLRFK